MLNEQKLIKKWSKLKDNLQILDTKEEQILKDIEAIRQDLLAVYKDIFVKTIDLGDRKIRFECTDKGKNELSKYGLELTNRKRQSFFESHKTIDQAHNDGCAICGSQLIAGFISFGYAPRFSCCYKHKDFLYIADRLIATDLEFRKTFIKKK